jgi:hypothetical protein
MNHCPVRHRESQGFALRGFFVSSFFPKRLHLFLVSWASRLEVVLQRRNANEEIAVGQGRSLSVGSVERHFLCY